MRDPRPRRRDPGVEFSSKGGLTVAGYTDGSGKTVRIPAALPLFTCTVNDALKSSADCSVNRQGDSLAWSSPFGLAGSVRWTSGGPRGWKGTITFKNASDSTLRLAEIVPLGESSERVFIRASGPSDHQFRLSRSTLFRPGVGPIGVVLPDNAWELGFCDAAAGNGRSLVAIARRTNSDSSDVRRFRTELKPGGWVQYDIYVDDHAGDWRDGLRLMFQGRWLYDLESFDDTLFKRPDLAWIRESYLLMLQFAWDREYYDALTGTSKFKTFLPSMDSLVGGYEAYMLWPTWPRLGLDQRNQWDMYRDLPGGIAELKSQVAFARTRGTKFFIAYNPWDESTRKEDHLAGMESMLRTLDADGVVLDTWGQSSRDFQAAADRVKPGVIMYSEGMAVPADMPGIVAGRVHDAIYMPPPLNLNKLIKPDFAIFRVIQLAEGRIHREIGVSLFNGYGNELNIMRPGRPDWIKEELAYLGLATKVLRENASAFTVKDWIPLLPTTVDSVWVNCWPAAEKTVYTVYSLRPEGYRGPLFAAPRRPTSIMSASGTTRSLIPSGFRTRATCRRLWKGSAAIGSGRGVKGVSIASRSFRGCSTFRWKGTRCSSRDAAAPGSWSRREIRPTRRAARSCPRARMPCLFWQRSAATRRSLSCSCSKAVSSSTSGS